MRSKCKGIAKLVKQLRSIYDVSLIITIGSILAAPLLSNLSNSVSPAMHEVEAQPVNTTLLRDTIDDFRKNSQELSNKLRDVNGDRVPNQYIVVLKDNVLTSDSLRSLAGKVTTQGASLRHLYDQALDGFAIRVPNEKALEGILKLPEVDFIEPDIKLKAFVQAVPTGVDRIDGDLSSTKSGNGDGIVNVDVGIMDSGVDLNHPDLNVYRHVTFVTGTTTGDDDNGHGTSVAGIVAAKDDSQGVVGVVPGARIWSMKVLDSNGIGLISDIIEGIDYATQHANEIDVVNLSFGGEGSSIAFRTAIIQSVSAGISYAAAAGNDAKDASSVIPASFPEVIAVSAIVDTDGKCGGISTPTTAGNDDTLADFSNFGSVVDMAAPGVLIKTTARASSYTSSFSGTSASTPHVTGAAALFKSENPGATPSNIRNTLRSIGSSPTTICDGNGNGYFTGDQDNNAEPLLYIGKSNSPPTANSQVVLTGKDTAKRIGLTASDPDMNPLTYSIVTQPQHGTITGGTGQVRTYTPTAGYTGTDSFTFRANDGTANSNTATVSITVVNPATCPGNLPVSSVSASGNDGNIPSNVLDNNLNTRWSNTGKSWIAVDLGSSKQICSVDTAWYLGSQREYAYLIIKSTDGNTWTDAFSGSSTSVTIQVNRANTAGSEKNFIPPTNARYIGIIAVGLSNSLVGITEVDVFGTSDTDKFGIKKLYPTKSGGEEWYLNMNNPTSDSRFNPQNTITKNPDGSWKMKATQVRMAVYTSTGYDGDDIATLDHSDIASKGYMLRPNDWRNFEMTQYVKVNTSPNDDNFSPNGRGGRHTGDGPPVGCEGSSMKGDVFFSGKVRFAKEQWHVSYVFTSLKTPTGSIEDKWVGIKFIVYNFVQNNKVVVKTELWLDTTNSGNFLKVDERVDSGGWGTEGTECGGAPDQIISWGGPITTFRWDTATDVDFKNLSVREIIPPQ